MGQRNAVPARDLLPYDQPLARVAVVGGGVHLCHWPAGCAVAGQEAREPLDRAAVLRLSAASAAWPIARIEAGLPSLTLKLISCARFWLRFGLANGASRANRDGKRPKKSNSSRRRWKCPEVSDEPA